VHLYIVRHGKAEKAAPSGRDDDRELKKRGVAQSAWLGQMLGRAMHRPSAEHSARPPTPDHAEPRRLAVVTSPVTRSRQTARTLWDQLAALGASASVPAEDERLSTRGTLASHLDALREHGAALAPGEGLVIVGHNPVLEQLIDTLAPSASGARLRTGECWALRIDVPAPRIGPRCATILQRLRMDDEDD
jgi:phosphohistidine phosphatase SixA